MPLYGQSSGSPRGFMQLSCFLIFIMGNYTPCFCIPSEAARTINLRSSRSKCLATVRNSLQMQARQLLCPVP